MLAGLEFTALKCHHYLVAEITGLCHQAKTVASHSNPQMKEVIQAYVHWEGWQEALVHGLLARLPHQLAWLCSHISQPLARSEMGLRGGSRRRGLGLGLGLVHGVFLSSLNLYWLCAKTLSHFLNPQL